MKKIAYSFPLIPAAIAVLVITFALSRNVPESVPVPDYGPHGEEPAKWALFIEATRDCGDMGVEFAYHEIFGVWVDAYSTYTDSLVILEDKPTHNTPNR